VLVDIFLHLFAGSTPEALLAAPAALAAAQAATAAARPAPPRPRAAPGPPGGAPPQHVLAAPPRPPRPCPAKTVARYGPARQVFAGAVYVRRHLDHSANVVLRHAPHRGELPRVKQGADPKQAKAHALERGGGGAAAAAPAPGDLRALALAARLDALMRRFLAESYTPLLGQVQKELRPGLGVTLLSEAEFEAFVRLVTLCTRYVRLQQERRLRAAMGGGAEGGAEGAAEGAEAAAAAAPEDGAASPFACLSATLGWETFHLVQVTWVLASDAEAKGATQKDRPDKAWGLQHALAPLVREMMLTLDLARVAGAPGDRRAADRLQRRLLHDDMRGSGLLPVVARLVRGYNYRFQPRQHAVDLVEVLHIVLCTLDRLAAATPGGFRVAAPPAPRRQAAPRRGTPGAAAPSAAEAEAGAEPEADAEAGAEAGNGVDGDGDGDGAAPPGAARAASEGGAAPAQPAAEQAQRQGGEESDDEDEAAAPRDAHAPAPPAPREVSFEACRRLRQECAQPAMVHFHAWLLQGYATNAPFTNHALVSFLNRVARPAPGGLGLEPMLWQLSVLRLAHSVLADRAARAAPALAPLLALCSRVARGALRRVAPEVYALEADDGGGGAALGAAAEEAEEGGGGGGEEAAAAAAERAAGAELRKKMAAGCASMMCVELLFWKGPNVAEAVGQEYSWRVSRRPPSLAVC
jgi:timeless